MSVMYQPKKEDKFTFGLWTVGNRGRDPFGDEVRAGATPIEAVRRLAELGAYGVNLHDNDLVPINATAGERDRIVAEFKTVLDDTGMKVPMATTNLFYHPVFRDGAFTSNDPAIRAYAVQKAMRGIDLGVELGAELYVFWGGREGAEVDAAKDPVSAVKRMREALNFLCEYVMDQGYKMRFCLEAKPNEPRGDIYLPTTGAMLGFIATLAHPEMVGLNPEVAHEQMAGLCFHHAVAQAIDAGKLWHIDLNAQKPGRFDQDLRFASEGYKGAFFLVKLLEDNGYDGPRHFDAHPYRTESDQGIWDFAAGCMRSYLILKEKVQQFNADPEIQEAYREANPTDPDLEALIESYDRPKAETLKAMDWDPEELAQRRLAYERLDQLTFELVTGAR